MQTTTTDLAEDLRQALTRSGLSPWSAARIANLVIYPAGQSWLMWQLVDNPQFTFPTLAHPDHRDELADKLRITTAAAEIVQSLLPAGVQR